MAKHSRRGRARTWILIIGGGLVFMIVGVFLLGRWGMNALAAEVQRGFEDHPIVLEQIGEIQDIDMNLVDSGKAEDDETFVYDVEGTKGNGQLHIRSEILDDGSEKIHSAKLILSTGEILVLDDFGD